MRKHHTHDAQVFRPSVLNHAFKPNAPLVRCEGRLLSDLSMPERDWTAYAAPAWERLGRPSPFRERSVPEFLKVAS